METNNCICYTDLAWPAAAAALRSRILVLPTGAVEQHGPHLPLSVDTDISNAIAKVVAGRLEAVLAPAIPYGARSLPHSGGGPSFPGTIFAHGSTITSFYRDVVRAYSSAGARRILVINGHYENEGFLFEAIDTCRERGWLSETRVVAFSWWSVVEEQVLEDLFHGDFPGWHAEHAGLTETAIMMYLRPDAVGERRCDNPKPPRAGIYRSDVHGNEVAVEGVLAKCSGATRAIGEWLFGYICDRVYSLATELLHREVLGDC